MNQGIDEETKEKNILVIGLGYVGFPLLIEACKAGFRVFGLDNNIYKVRDYLNGQSQETFYDKDTVERMIFNERISLHSTLDGIDTFFDVIVICVPTPLNEIAEPDLSHIRSAMETVLRVYKKGTLVILESSSFPGTTRTLVYNSLKSAVLESDVQESPLVAYSPERIDPGNQVWNLNNTPKLVSGINSESLSRAIDFYKTFVDVIIPIEHIENAELAKLFENTFRLVNISLVNEFVTELRLNDCNPMIALEAAFTKPFGIMKFNPSPGIGGHCIPVDPVYLINWARQNGANLSIVESANTYSMFQYRKNIEFIEKSIGSEVRDKHILLVGVTYKPNVPDTRESASYKLLKALKQKGAYVKWYDPLSQDKNSDRIEVLDNWSGDLIVLMTKHTIFQDINFRSLAPFFVDLNFK